MAWIESHQSLGQHPKLLKLAGALEVGTPQAIGHLLYLWWWALDYAPDGDLSKFTPKELGWASRWFGDALRFYESMKECAWIDPDGKLHDWVDYAGNYILGRERQKRYRQKRHALRNGDVTDDVTVTTTIPTNQPYQPTIPTNRRAASPRPSARFEKPTAEQVTNYAKSIGFVLDGQHFCDNYESKGWKIGSTPMKSWEACVRTWRKKQGGFGIGKTESAVGKTGGFVPTKQPLF